jgi:hypothetical protein
MMAMCLCMKKKKHNEEKYNKFIYLYDTFYYIASYKHSIKSWRDSYYKYWYSIKYYTSITFINLTASLFVHIHHCYYH